MQRTLGWILPNPSLSITIPRIRVHHASETSCCLLGSPGKWVGIGQSLDPGELLMYVVSQSGIAALRHGPARLYRWLTKGIV